MFNRCFTGDGFLLPGKIRNDEVITPRGTMLWKTKTACRKAGLV